MQKLLMPRLLSNLPRKISFKMGICIALETEADRTVALERKDIETEISLHT